MGGVDMAPNTVELPRKFHSHIHLLSRNLPPHLGLIALVAWSGLDDRRFARHGQAVAGVYDVLRDIGRDRYADIGSIYRPEAIHSGAVGTSSTSKRAKEKIYGTGVLRHSIRIGARW